MRRQLIEVIRSERFFELFSANTDMYKLGAKDKLNIKKKLKAAIPDGSVVQILSTTDMADGKRRPALGQSINRT